jgi:hypothetical protein
MYDAFFHDLHSQHRQHALLREAERERLIRLAKASRPRRPPLRQWALCWLGRRLVAWGRRLQGYAAPALDSSSLDGYAASRM